MENRVKTNYTEDELYEFGRTYALEHICSDMDYPNDWDEDQIEEFYETYEILDVTPNEEEQTIEVEISGDCGTYVRAVAENGQWSIVEQNYCS